MSYKIKDIPYTLQTKGIITDVPLYSSGSPGAICGRAIKKTATKPSASFATPTFGEWTEKMAESMPRQKS